MHDKLHQLFDQLHEAVDHVNAIEDDRNHAVDLVNAVNDDLYAALDGASDWKARLEHAIGLVEQLREFYL